MWDGIRNWMLLAAIGACSATAEAQVIHNSCGQPAAQCTCTALKPVVQTQYRQEQYVTYRDIPQTEYRREAHLETVPVTTYKTVTVDEGSYQQVWVPKLVTKQIAQTDYQQRLTCRTVPYQVTRRVAEVATRLVPQQTVRYVPHQFQTTVSAALPYSTTVSALPVMGSPIRTTAAIPTLPPLKTASSVPVMPAMSVPPTADRFASSVTETPVPDPKFLDTPGSLYDEWTTVPSRSGARSASQADRLGAYEPIAPRSEAARLRTAGGRKLFVPAPSAATVWQARTAALR